MSQFFKNQQTPKTDVMGVLTKVMEFLVKFGIPIGLIFLVWPWLKKYGMNMMASNEKTEQEIEKDREYQANKNPVTLQEKLDAITTRKDIQADAKELAHHLGTKYDTGSWTDIFNYKKWTENDGAAATILIRQQYNYKFMEKLYFTVTRSHNLTDDILEYLDKSELEKVRKYINI